MDEYARLENARQTCFVKCRDEKSKVPSDYFEDEELTFFHNVIQRASCIRECEENKAGLQPTGGIPINIAADLHDREGYNYLQMALYQVCERVDGESKVRRGIVREKKREGVGKGRGKGRGRGEREG